MILHLTTEIFQQNYGGIGTAVTSLYTQKNTNDVFLLIGGVEARPPWLPADIHYMSFSEFNKIEKLPFLARVTFVHNVFLMRPTLPGKKIYVSHSNLEMEKQFNPRIEERFLLAFRETLRLADEVFCVSEFEKDLLMKTSTAIVQNKPIHVAYNGIDPTLRDAQGPRSVYGYIGRLDFRKGIFNLIEDFPSDRRLLIAAGGTDKFADETFRMMTLRLSRLDKKNIIPVGYCQGKRKDSFFRSVDSLIIPSLYEPFGLTALEGMQYQKPIIVAKRGGLCEIFGEEHQLYFNPENIQDMSAVIRKLESFTPADRQKVISYQNQRLQRFSVSAMAHTYQSMDSSPR